ncbi:MAG: outer membrane lipoprotein chaperone LolA [Deltaproteobacteria bacterium]|nr:MAG: outer membrane lipoprotein chaperone LolA [Deltaproteobacteria bacterium]
MRRFLVCLAAAVALPAPARADELAEALRMLQQRYESTRTLVAKFSQEVESPTLAGKLTSSGTLNFEKPNRMRWDYAPPERQTILSDGDTLWIYQPDEKQVLKAPLREAFQATTPVTFLAGLGHVDRDFTPTLESSAKDRWVIRLVPREDRGVGTLVLVVHKPDAAIEEARITDPLGTTTRLVLTDERRNVPLGADLFRFTPPPGVDVVRPPAY